MGVALLFGSLAGPWLTLAFPVAFVFAAHDRRRGVRVAAGATAAAIAFLMAASGPGRVLLAGGVAAVLTATWLIDRGRECADLGGLAVPTLATAGTALAAAVLAAPAAVRRWEEAIGSAVADSGARALERYRGLGMDPDSLDALESVTAAAAAAVVQLWPALVALGIWPGVWLAHRLLARHGRIGHGLAARLGNRPFLRFRAGETAVWILIAGLAALWLPPGPARRVGANVALALAVVYALQGLAVALWWARRRGVGLVWRVVVLALLFAFLPPVLAAGLFVLGLADHWRAFRDELPDGGGVANDLNEE